MRKPSRELMARNCSGCGEGVWLGVVLPVFVVLVLIVPAVPALGSHRVNSSAAHEATTVARVTSIPEAPAASPSVAYTLDLCTNHLYAGNALPTNCSGVGPMGVAYDSGMGEIFVTNYVSNNVSVISDANNTAVAVIHVGGGPGAVAYDSGKGEVLVANYGSNDVSVISDTTNTVIATIPVGVEPVGVAYDSGKGEVFVANGNSNNVSVISDASNSVVATIPVGTGPVGVAYDSGKGEVFVTNYLSDSVSVISDASNKMVANIPVGINPGSIEYDSGKGEVFVANSNSNNVSVISDATNKVVATIPVGTEPGDVAYDSGKGEVFVTNYLSDSVSVISDASNKVVATILIGTGPAAVAYDSGKREVLVANYGSYNVSVISGTTNKVVATIPVWFNPGSVGYDGGKGEVFVANSNSNNVSVISDTTNKVVATIPVGIDPDGIEYDSGKGEVFVTNFFSNNVSVISDTTNAVIASIPVRVGPVGVAYDSGKGEVFVANAGSNNVSVISDTTNAVTSTVTVGAKPTSLVFDPSNGYLYVSNFGQGTISILSTGPAPTPYPVSFSESGLPAGTNWSMTLNSQTLYSTSSTITFNKPNGTYPFSVGTVPGYTANVTSGNLTVNGGPVSRSIAFTPQTTLTSVSVSPPNATVPVGWTQNFTATPTCFGGLCPSNVTYSWSITNILYGTLNSTTNPTVSFTAGSVQGNVALYVNATLAGKRVQSLPVNITIGPPVAMLYAVSVSPSGANLTVGGSGNFTATPICAGGTCPTGATFAWTLSNTTLGVLNTTSGPQVVFTAGTLAGKENLSVNVSLTGRTARSSPVPINISTKLAPTLGYVSLTPLAATVNVSGTQSFTATVGCNGGTCPSGSTYTWSLNNSLGKLNISSGPQVLFTANSTAGLVNLTVTAHLNGKTATNSSTITIKKASSPPSTYAVTFSEAGLPAGTTWSVSLNGSMKSGTGSIVFTEPNGTYSFNVGVVSGYTASPISGSFTVSGVAVSKAITFTALPPGQYSLVFSETGLPSGTNWSVAVGTTTHTSTGSTISFTEANGTYSYTVGAVTGFTATPSSGSVTVNGAAKTVSIAFAKAGTGTTYSVTFTETGLPTGTSWSVTLNGQTLSSTTSTITFQEANGSYAFTVGSVSGYTVGPSPGTIKVNGAAISQAITFTSSTSPGKNNPTTGFLGLTGYDGYILIGVIVAAAAAGAVILLLRKRSPPRGYGVQDSKNIADGAAEQVAVE